MVTFYVPISCPWCGFQHNRLILQTRGLIMNEWQVRNMNRCPPRKGGCGKNIFVGLRPKRVYIEQKLAKSPEIKLEEFVRDVSQIYIDRNNLARFNVEGTIVALEFDVKIKKYPHSLDEWFKRDKWRRIFTAAEVKAENEN